MFVFFVLFVLDSINYISFTLHTFFPSEYCTYSHENFKRRPLSLLFRNIVKIFLFGTYFVSRRYRHTAATSAQLYVCKMFYFFGLLHFVNYHIQTTQNVNKSSLAHLYTTTRACRKCAAVRGKSFSNKKKLICIFKKEYAKVCAKTRVLFSTSRGDKVTLCYSRHGVPAGDFSDGISRVYDLISDVVETIYYTIRITRSVKI